MAMNYRYPQMAQSERCVNCGWNMGIRVEKQRSNIINLHKYVRELSTPERDLLKTWLPAVDNIADRRLCKDCERLLLAGSQAAGEDRARHVGYSALCAACGDLLTKRSRATAVNADKPYERYLFQERLDIPIQGDMKLCRICRLKAIKEYYKHQMNASNEVLEDDPDENKTLNMKIKDTQSEENEPANATQQPQSYLTTELLLDGYKKVVEKGGGKCAACDEVSSRRLNLPTRQQLLLHQKLYVSTSARACEKHHNIAKNWTDIENISSHFTGEEIADMVFLLKANWPIDFEKLEELDPFVLEQWMGMSLEDFQKEYEKSPLKEKEGGKFALAIYLVHTHTKECATVLASLTQQTRSAIETAINMAKEYWPECALGNTKKEWNIPIEEGDGLYAKMK
ncbi:hypothetical protein NE865_12691 [Phthorimaea operculella]|nr:hypothetical protein NE865_12691 [Phthorimaea operculella]